jgi:hypothetical protein|tara:strand:- start:74 stop:589 length:516 start_codon:yes stop_codon:yes gene_type:complete
MKIIILVLVANLLLVECSSTLITKVSLNEIPRIEKDDYIIIAFEGYNIDTDIKQEAEVGSYVEIEDIIKNHCKKRNNKAYYTTHYLDKIYYSYEPGFKATGQRYWCAKTLEDAKKLYKEYLRNPPDEYLSGNQRKFAKKSLYWIKNNQLENIREELNHMTYYAKIAELSPN